jgi:hypothetical protein
MSRRCDRTKADLAIHGTETKPYDSEEGGLGNSFTPGYGRRLLCAGPSAKAIHDEGADGSNVSIEPAGESVH